MDSKTKINTLESLGISNNSPCFIIAEIGQNHQGSLDNAKKLIAEAKKCGVNCVKFQKSSLNYRFTRRTLEEEYKSPNAFGKTYGEHRSHLEFSDAEFKELQNFAEHEIGIMFTASAMDIPSADLLIDMKVPFIKIGSGDTNNFLLIEHIARHKIPIVLSTGMQDLETVKMSFATATKYNSEVALLHCVSSYPTTPEDVNLRILDIYRKLFPNTVLGYSGHEKGILISIAAVARGAKVIEKHFTLDKNQKGTDHQCSLDPLELDEMVKGIRDVEKALENTVPCKKILQSEEPCRLKLGKSIVASRKLEAGEEIKLSDLSVKVSRPMGLAPQRIFEVVGSKARETIEEDEPVQFSGNNEICKANCIQEIG